MPTDTPSERTPPNVPNAVGERFVVANGEKRFLAEAVLRLDDVPVTPSGAGQDFATWWEHRPFANLNKRECELAWNAALAAQSQPAAAPQPITAEEERREWKAALAEAQLAAVNCMSDFHAQRLKDLRNALASMPPEQDPLSCLREQLEKLPRYSLNRSIMNKAGSFIKRDAALAALRQEERKSHGAAPSLP